MIELIKDVLISEDEFKQNSPIVSNMDFEEFVPYIGVAQELYLEPILGEPLISELKNQIVSNRLTESNSDLLIKLAPSLSFYAVYQALPFHWATIVNKGITICESENSKGVDIKDIVQLRRWIKDGVEVLKAQLIDFLHENKSKYPSWKSLR